MTERVGDVADQCALLGAYLAALNTESAIDTVLAVSV
jgi:hypothetical protein